MTVDIEDRIRDALHEVASGVDYTDAGVIELAPHRRRGPIRALVVAGLVAACAAGVALAVGTSTSHRATPATGFTPPSTAAQGTTTTLLTPSDPKTQAALASWSTFPVDRAPRPLILIEGTVDAPARGFTDPDIAVADAQKEAFDSGAISTPPSLPAGPPTAGGYPVIGAGDALARLRASGSGTSATTLTTTDLRFGTASFDTDRGPMTLPAWLVSFQGVSDPAAVLAVAPSALYEPSSGPAGSSIMSATPTDDPRVVTINFVGGPPGTGPCATTYEAHVAESATAVSVSVSPLKTPEFTTRGSTVIGCTAIGAERHVTITLRDPLGARVLVDAQRQGAFRLDP
jgi:hypothetical protein